MTDEPLSLLARLKQHHLYGVVVAYAVVVGFLIQLVSRAFPYLDWVAPMRLEALYLTVSEMIDVRPTLRHANLDGRRSS